MAQRGRHRLPYVPCSVEGCETLTNWRYQGVFYCKHHLGRIYSFGEPEPDKFQYPVISGGMICKQCKIHKPVDHFSCHKHYRFGIEFTCKTCKSSIRKENHINYLTIKVPQCGVRAIPSYPLANHKIIKRFYVKKQLNQRTCRVSDCENNTATHWSLCTKHRYYYERFGDVRPPSHLPCSVCSLDKPIEDFMLLGGHRLSTTGCKACRDSRKKEVNKRRIKNRMSRIKTNPVKYAEYKKKQNKKKAVRIKNNPVLREKKRIAHRTHCINRRARKKGNGGAHTVSDIQFLLAQQKEKCVCCRKSIKKQYHIDHIIPIALGGGSEKENLQLLCPACNRQKCAKHPVEFMQEQGFLI